MIKAFEIRFDFPLAYSDLTISLKAIAEIHHSDTFYIVHDFRFAEVRPDGAGLSVLPAQEIKQITRGNSKVWVHKDSERESLLSVAIGKAIESELEKS